MSRSSSSAPASIPHDLIGQALDGMCVGLVIMNPATRVTWMNRAAENLLGSGRSDCLGQMLGHVLKDPQFAAFWQDAHMHDENVMGAVSLHWPKVCELKVNSTLCIDNQGEPIGRALLFCDVTQERAAQVQLSREITDRLLSLTANDHDAAAPHAGLTAQELQVLRLVGNGLSNQDIAQHIHVAPSTLRSHLKHIYHKTGLKSRAEAVRYAIENGLS